MSGPEASAQLIEKRKQFGCWCGRSYTYRSGLQQHRLHECGKEPAFACTLCPYRAKLKYNLRRHFLIKHSHAKLNQFWRCPCMFTNLLGINMLYEVPFFALSCWKLYDCNKTLYIRKFEMFFQVNAIILFYNSFRLQSACPRCICIFRCSQTLLCTFFSINQKHFEEFFAFWKSTI